MGSMYTSKNIIERLELEQQELPILAQTTGERAELLLRNILNAGSTHIRTHVNMIRISVLKLRICTSNFREYERCVYI